MNSLNAFGFLVLGSAMNAVPALAPSFAARGPLIGNMTTSTIWLHFMGLLIGAIGSSTLIRDAYHFARPVFQSKISARPAAVPAAQPVDGVALTNAVQA